MSKAKTPRRSQNKLPAFSSSDDDDDFVIGEPVNPVQDDEPSDNLEKDVYESFREMSEDEMAQHLKLCMKLSAENKINMKNAFGLRLIEILNKMVHKSGSADLQQASLSLQASSKIYAGRVEALYQDTMKFHSHLQSIVSGGKKEKKKNIEDDMVDEDNEDSSAKVRAKSKSKCKSFIKSEESLTMEQDTSSQSAREPHANFRTINAAFSTSRFAPKLLSSLRLSDDSCKLRCAVSELCYKPKIPVTVEQYGIPSKMKGLLEKIKNINIGQSSLESLSESARPTPAPFISTPKPTTPPPLFDDDDDNGGFAAPDPVQDDVSVVAGSSEDVYSVESAIERFDVLNITVDAFVNDISAAITDQGVDHRLLPPNSVLKKMLDRSKRSSVRPSTVGKSTKRKPKEPFFAGRSANDVKHFFQKGRTVTVSQKTLSEWNVEKTSNIDLGYEFIEELESKKEDGGASPTLDEVITVLKQNDPQYHFKYYFNKMSQIWKFSRRKLCLNESFAAEPGANQIEKTRVGSLAPTDPENLVASFRNLSIHDSVHDFPNSPEDAFDDNAGDPGFIDTNEEEYVLPPEPFETDIEDLMVKPPELVRPVCMKFDRRPMNLNTEKIKDLLSVIITRRLEHTSPNEDEESYVLFSEVYEELKNKLKKEISEFISMQFTFVVLLILANQKTLLIENVNDNSDLRIKQDICEIEEADNF